ncbi:MAG TPA: PQQ-binding-like beta-propeller repeat protein [Anaeromyxobacter sp.]|nr:PQQ-binding-like beta-propeller repeat protein [Anaeromyxobacter sp.]
MRRILSIACAVAALACGSVKDRQACGVSTECPVGQYCAHADGESRCWEDAVDPVVQTVTASCPAATCLRDGVLHVEATVGDDAEVLDAAVALDLAPGSPVPMTRSGTRWVADVQLRAFPFAAFSRNVVATVTARDGARNDSAPRSAAALGVTRLRWTYDAGAPITSPAVMDDGTAVVGVSATANQLRAIAPDGSLAWSLSVGGSSFVTAAPAVGDNAIWVGSEDLNLYGVELDGSAVKAGVGVNTGGALKGSVAVLPDVGKEWAFATSDAGFIGVASTVSNENDLVGPTTAFSVGPVVGLDGRAYAGTAAGSLGAYRLTTSPAVTLSEAWRVPVGVEVASPLAIDSDGSIWSGAVEKLTKTVPGDTSGTANVVATLPARIVDSPVILANGDVLVGDQVGVLHRFTPSGASVWSSANLGAAIHAVSLLSGGGAAIVVPTAGGKLFALRDDGSEVWSTTLDAAKALRAPNIFTTPGQTSNVISTAYVASSSGKLFAVIVDGQLDTAAPWPKAFHDPRNTNHAGPQP